MKIWVQMINELLKSKELNAAELDFVAMLLESDKEPNFAQREQLGAIWDEHNSETMGTIE